MVFLPRRHEGHEEQEEKPKYNLRALRVFVVKYFKLRLTAYQATTPTMPSGNCMVIECKLPY